MARRKSHMYTHTHTHAHTHAYIHTDLRTHARRQVLARLQIDEEVNIVPRGRVKIQCANSLYVYCCYYCTVYPVPMYILLLCEDFYLGGWDHLRHV